MTLIYTITWKSLLTLKKIAQKIRSYSKQLWPYGRNWIVPWYFFEILTWSFGSHWVQRTFKVEIWDFNLENVTQTSVRKTVLIYLSFYFFSCLAYCLQYMSNRCLLRFEYQLPHPILCTTLATDKKWPLIKVISISYQLGNQLTKNGPNFSK